MTDTSAADDVLAADLASVRTFVTSVASVEDVNPHLRRITFAGGDLATFEPLGPDTFLYVLGPPPGRCELTIDSSFTWDAYRSMAEADRPVGAYYTVRRWDPARAELEMLFVLHEVGHGADWARRAVPGAPVALWGPRRAFLPPVDTDWYLLVADETGLPAVAAILDWLPSDVPVQVVAEVACSSERQSLRVRDGVDVTWLHRDGAAAGTTGRLLDAVRSLPMLPGFAYAWGAAESREITAVRTHLRHAVGLPQERVSMTGYWRLGDGGD